MHRWGISALTAAGEGFFRVLRPKVSGPYLSLVTNMLLWLTLLRQGESVYAIGAVKMLLGESE